MEKRIRNCIAFKNKGSELYHKKVDVREKDVNIAYGLHMYPLERSTTVSNVV